MMKMTRYGVGLAGLGVLLTAGCASMDVTSLVSPDHPRDIHQLTLFRLTLRDEPAPDEPVIPDDADSESRSDSHAFLVGSVR